MHCDRAPRAHAPRPWAFLLFIQFWVSCFDRYIIIAVISEVPDACMSDALFFFLFIFRNFVAFLAILRFREFGRSVRYRPSQCNLASVYKLCRG